MPEVYAFIENIVATHARRARHKGTPKICDLGCGDGSLMKRLAQHGTIYGVDMGDRNVARALDEGLSVVKLNLDEEKTPFADQSFDIVICSEVIEHVLILDRMLMESYRIIRDDGLFVVTTPNLASFGKRLLLLYGHNPFMVLPGSSWVEL